ncbi:aldo/keto reductase [Nocardioides mesophilus]|uniref:Aldo/keto reductase n=1 Tax=Nocardioides mesophilus TaxID=433659 RepID=A0A7G9R8W2_9ACTN|nr:aldo/keto reductase [Nocardioides mesophilus]QNN52037.1 aldo/keto reductase [Nocardioides mesophilus]
MHPSQLDAGAAGTWMLGHRAVNRMGFGSMRVTAGQDRERAIRVIRQAVELGVDHIDTAAFYFSPGGILAVGSGPTRHATELIREALPAGSDDVVISTKVGPGFDSAGRFFMATTATQLRRQVEENLRRLGRDCLDVVNLRILRKPGEDSIADRFGALAEMRDAGLIRHLGLSNVRVDHIDEAQAIAPVVCVQNAYAVDLRRDDDVLEVCAQRGIAFVPFFALAGTRREAGATTEHSRAVQTVAAAHGVSPHQVRLAWTLHRGAHVLAIPGTGDPAHLRENVATAALRLSEQDLLALA